VPQGYRSLAMLVGLLFTRVMIRYQQMSTTLDAVNRQRFVYQNKNKAPGQQDLLGQQPRHPPALEPRKPCVLAMVACRRAIARWRCWWDCCLPG
jgi:hypothetical protein